jgi:hypothetical protein
VQFEIEICIILLKKKGLIFFPKISKLDTNNKPQRKLTSIFGRMSSCGSMCAFGFIFQLIELAANKKVDYDRGKCWE